MKKLILILSLILITILFSCKKPEDTIDSKIRWNEYNIRWSKGDSLKIDSTLSKYPVQITKTRIKEIEL